MTKHRALAACLALALPLTLSACGGADEQTPGAAESSATAVESPSGAADSTPSAADSASVPAELQSLSSWKGEWNNIDNYLDDPALAPGYEAAAKKNNSTPDEEKAALHKRRASDFGGLVIDGDKITFLDNFPSKDGKEISSSEYTWDKTYESVVGGKTRTWYAFKATDSAAKYPTVMFFPIDHEEDLLHFHMRYGNTPDELLAKEDWFPTVVSPDTTTEQLIAEISE
ncbi:ZinT/AdcA family metal-binding protein [Gephyromycinifex aptenodytis]|uniref:ZinT/AdcA family metal-binding protein n=1 Tax=Gephyromycinifex aptenodytis TaxID=2716227 RepID=UPI00144713AF|nr:ZinT/AdcA family metal-binding protein [Gephyromycinifex aptenodytis]